MVPFWGRCTTHFRTYFSGDCWGYDLDFDPCTPHTAHLGFCASQFLAKVSRCDAALFAMTPLVELGLRPDTGLEAASSLSKPNQNAKKQTSLNHNMVVS